MIGVRKVGRTDLRVTEVGFGCAPIGNLYAETTDDAAFDALDAAWSAGVRYFDTAPHYGLGLSERRLGDYLATKRRSEFVVSTKVGRILEPNPDTTGSDLAAGGFAVPDTLTRRRDYSADGVRRSLDDSLRRLRMDRVDIVLVHDPDDFVDQTIAEAIPALVELRDEGVIRAIGVGMNQWQAPLRIVRECDIDVVMLAGRWTLVDRSGAELMAECARRGVSVLAAAPYNSGLLAGEWPTDGAHFDYRPAPPELLAHARDLARAATDYGTTLPALAMQFPLAHWSTSSVVTGLRSATQVAAAVDRVTQSIRTSAWEAVAALRVNRT